MSTGRRLLALLVVLAAIGLPAGVLRAACVGKSCTKTTPPAARIPFCPLPKDLKAEIVNGFREGRSPDVLAVTNDAALWGGMGEGPLGGNPAWPSLKGAPDPRVPIVFAGDGVNAAAPVPDGTGLDQIAPTLESVIGFRRPHPDVRAGVAIPGVATGRPPALVLEVVLKGAGSSDLEADPKAWPFLRSLMREGAGTLNGDPGSLPLDPVATITTIGTGGLPSQHGITGVLLRNDDGKVTVAWSKDAPLSIIATLGDDLDEFTQQRSQIGLVESDPTDGGLIGGNWYLGADRDQIVRAPGDPATATGKLLASGYGDDSTPDLLGVVLEDSVPEMDAQLEEIVAEVRGEASGPVAIVVAGSGTNSTGEIFKFVTPRRLVARVEAAVPGSTPIVTAVAPGGIFLDQEALAETGLTGGKVATAMLGLPGPGGGKLFADAFQGFAVSFARYC